MARTPVRNSGSSELLQGTLDMLILKTLAAAGKGGAHGYAIVRRLKQVSDDVLQVEEGSLYPALHRLEKRGYLEADWRRSESNRRAKFYKLTAKGNDQLESEAAAWDRLAGAIEKVMNARTLSLSLLPWEGEGLGECGRTIRVGG